MIFRGGKQALRIFRPGEGLTAYARVVLEDSATSVSCKSDTASLVPGGLVSAPPQSSAHPEGSSAELEALLQRRPNFKVAEEDGIYLTSLSRPSMASEAIGVGDIVKIRCLLVLSLDAPKHRGCISTDLDGRCRGATGAGGV